MTEEIDGAEEIDEEFTNIGKEMEAAFENLNNDSMGMAVFWELWMLSSMLILMKNFFHFSIGPIQDALQLSEEELKKIVKINLMVSWFLMKAVCRKCETKNQKEGSKECYKSLQARMLYFYKRRRREKNPTRPEYGSDRVESSTKLTVLFGSGQFLKETRSDPITPQINSNNKIIARKNLEGFLPVGNLNYAPPVVTSHLIKREIQ
uniref:Uncharacterized protein n=1 Tax=Cucumis melo TaxID=3656 RepID=A0A9I9E6T6_CUCME